MSDSKKGTLNTLLNYRFVRKPSAKLSHTDSQSQGHKNGLSKEDSAASLDSQATIPYNNSQELGGSQATQEYGLGDAIDTNHQTGATPGGIAADSAPASPVFTSKLAGSTNAKGQQTPQVEASNSTLSGTPNAVPSPGPWISKPTTAASETAAPAKFRRVQRPADTDSEDESHHDNSLNGLSSFAKLKKLFPNGSENRMRAALIVHPNNFEAAVEFVKKDFASVAGKRPMVESPENKPSYKRIKPMPESPTEPIVLSVENIKQMEEKKQEKEDFQKGLDFLRGCFPLYSADHIRQVLKSHNGNTDQAADTLSKSQGDEEKRIAEANGANSSGKQPGKISLLKMNNGTKVKKKAREEDISDDEDEYDDYDGSDDSDDSEDLDNRSKSETDNFLTFFEEATLEELSAMPGCSKKKAELIITLRPFQTWEKLFEEFTSHKQLSTALISGCKEVMQVRNTVRRLMVRCESISQQMGLVVSRLTSAAASSGDNGGLRIAKQPELLNKDFVLQPYQLIGLSWLRIMHEQELNGILADEMGLGKTIQAIAFLAHLMEEGEEGPHVIVVPSSTIENWLREMQRWCPALKIIVYYGSQEERRAVRQSIFHQGEQFNVLLTTYNMATGGVEDRVLFKKFEFHYAVFDEGHMLKNMSSMRFQNLMKISAERRLLLTGTPLQNNLLELMSLLCFVMPEIFQGKTEHLKKVFAMITRSSDEKQKSRFERDRIAQAKRIMKPFILRRLKKDVLQMLPQKTEFIEKCVMSASQQDLYDRLLNKYTLSISEADEAAGGDKKDENKSGGVGIFMQFRKASNHPLLLRNHFKKAKLRKMAKAIAKEPSHAERGALPELILEDMMVMNDFELMALCREHPKYLKKFNLDPSVILDSGKFNKLDELLPQMKKNGDRVLLFSQFTMMLDVVEHYLNQRGHKFIRLDGQTPVPDRLQLIDRFNTEPDILIFLLSTRAGGVGINLCAANTIILHDIDFNPYNDKQAEDRCHRLGQKREVKVHKLICESTVDEAMLECANGKLALERDLNRAEGEEESEENTKDVLKMLKEVLRLRQKAAPTSSPTKSVPNGASSSSKNNEEDDDEDEEEEDEDDLQS